jgi:hypothetical protein
MSNEMVATVDIGKKFFGQIDGSDIQALCTRAAPEDQTIEFKETLPGDRGRTDPWIAGSGDPTAYAQDRLFREITAFANFQGGTLFVGITETNDKPPRAAGVQPLPRIHDLAAKIEDAARDRIEPPIPGLQIRGIEMGGPGAGVLILRAPASVSGPHRVKGSGHAFIRRGASSVQMTMTEIREISIDLSRGADRLKAAFEDRATGFTQWLQSTTGEYGGCRITAMPTGVGPQLGGFEPIVRGVRRYNQDTNTRIEVYENGAIDYWYRHQPVQGGIHFYFGWVLGAYLAVLDAIDSARTLAEVPDWEFVIEFALDGLTGTPRFGGGRVPLTELVFGLFNPGYGTAKIGEIPRKFPTVVYRAKGERDDAINTIFNDLMDASGGPRNPDPLKLV